MEAKAIARYVRIAPRKLRIVIDLIRGKAVVKHSRSSNIPLRLVLRLSKKYCAVQLQTLNITMI